MWAVGGLTSPRTTTDAWDAVHQAAETCHVAPWTSWGRAEMEKEDEDTKDRPDTSGEQSFD